MQNYAYNKENLETLKELDEEILELVEDGGVYDKIEQADTLKERIHVATIASNKVLATKTEYSNMVEYSA